MPSTLSERDKWQEADRAWMGYGSEKVFSEEKLERLLRHAKVTQQSIQAVSTWILERRASLVAIADVWRRLMKEGEAANQVVYLYIANDVMQVGVRKYGKHIAEMFEAHLLDIVEFVMAQGDEKVKRCVIKIIGIWKERHTVTPALLTMLQNVCAGKPAVDPQDSQPAQEDDIDAEKAAFLRDLETDAAVDRALEDMAEVPESDATAGLDRRLQDLVTATISADLLSDRMFQLESSISTFHHACEAFENPDARTANDDEATADSAAASRSAGNIVWELVDTQTFDLDLDKSREHVQQYRDNLDEQNAKREDLLQQLRALSGMDPFAEPIFHTSRLLRDQQAETVDRLYSLCLKAELLDKQRAAERQKAQAQRPPYILTPSQGTYDAHPNASRYSPRTDYWGAGDHQSNTYNRPQSYSGGGDYGMSRPPLQRRHSNSTADGMQHDEPYYASKRAKLHHSHSLDSPPRARTSRWDNAPGRAGPTPSPRRDDYDYGARFAPSPRDGGGYYAQRDDYRDAYPRRDDRREYPRERW
ncbi:hypothetical protein ATCC90586_002841 [Pythium insidiosum]|nr:hypothetical protein ATCC90586_002841 [Pythium insidiosum]